jgi:hypothetical protein
LPIGIGKARSVADETASHDVLAILIKRGQRTARRQRRELFRLPSE